MALRHTNQKRQKHRRQRSPDRTKMYNIGLYIDGKVYVAEDVNKLYEKGIHLIQVIRTITPQAAARRFIRNTLPGLYMGNDYMDTGLTPGDIAVHHSKNKKSTSYDRRARAHQDDAKKRAKNADFVVLK